MKASSLSPLSLSLPIVQYIRVSMVRVLACVIVYERDVCRLGQSGQSVFSVFPADVKFYDRSTVCTVVARGKRRHAGLVPRFIIQKSFALGTTLFAFRDF